jgi:hypothetical protein
MYATLAVSKRNKKIKNFHGEKIKKGTTTRRP